MSVEIEGLEDLEEELQGLAERLERAGGEISMNELFTDSFMKSYTEFDSLDEFFAESPWVVESESDFENIPADEIDAYVENRTDFESWDAMLRAGGREYVFREAADR